MADHFDWKTIAALISIIVGLAGIVAILVRQGRYAERIENKITANEEKVALIERTLWKKDGTMAIVTHDQHDKLQANCRKDLKKEMNHQNEDITEIKSGMKEIVLSIRDMERKQDERWLELRDLVKK